MISSRSNLVVLLGCLMVLMVMVMSPLTLVSGRSNGILAYCDLTPVKNWPNGVFGRNMSVGGLDSGIMRWVNAPTPVDFYTLRTGDSPNRANDPTSYTPGEWTELHIRVLDLKRRFIGLVLYATPIAHRFSPNSTKENQVGNWTFPSNAPFQTPTTCGMTTVTHRDANLKPLHNRIYFMAPVGTGTVTFRILLKQGEQNKGSFFYPSVPLTLTEGPAPFVPTIPPNANTSTVYPGPPVSQTVVGAAGLTCADVCNQQTPATPYCDADGVKSIRNLTSLQSKSAGHAPCRLPLLAGCPYAGGAHIDTASGFCTFRTDDLTTCPAAFNSSAAPDHEPDVCFTAAAATSQPICVCTNNKEAQPTNPFAGEQATSAAIGRLGSSSIGLLLAAVMALFTLSDEGSNKKTNAFSVICLFVILFGAHPTDAHNYIKSLHRANEAAVSVPCQERIGNQPHVQIIAGQTFEIEWSVGHGDSTAGPFYFLAVAEKDYSQLLATNLTAIIQDYVKNSPTNASIIPSAWQKFHIHNTNEQSIDTYFDVPTGMATTDPDYIMRDPTYAKMAHPSQYQNNKTIIQTRFLPQYTQNDKRASYASAKYPWIESASIFYNYFVEHTIYATQADIARFTLPARSGPGNYVYYFNWYGYKDCIDINVVPGTTPVVNRYGIVPSPTAPLTPIKQDHCEYTYIGSAATPCHKVDPKTMDVSQCLRECSLKGSINCNGVQVVRAQNPTVTLPFTPNIPFVPFSKNFSLDASIYQPCAELSVHVRSNNGCANPPSSICDPKKLNLTANDFVCFGLVPVRNQDNQVEEDFQISTEPEDPVFHSTCYQMDAWKSFLNIEPAVYTPPLWSAAGDHCIACDFHAGLSALNSSTIPNWMNGITDTCMDCSIVNSPEPVSVLAPIMAGADQPVAGKDAVITTSSSSTSTSSSFADNKVYLGLTITAVLIGVILISLGIYFLLRFCRGRQSSALAIGKLSSPMPDSSYPLPSTSTLPTPHVAMTMHALPPAISPRAPPPPPTTTTIARGPPPPPPRPQQHSPPPLPPRTKYAPHTSDTELTPNPAYRS